jgi:hypothetical protein
MAKSVKFTATGTCLLGNFSSGDTAHNIPDDLADHLVKDARCAEYWTPPAAAPAAPAAPEVQAEPPAKRGKAKKSEANPEA